MNKVNGNHRDRAKALILHIATLPRSEVAEAIAVALFEVEKETAKTVLVPIMNRAKDEGNKTMNQPKRKGLHDISEFIRRQLNTDWGMSI